jgi:hypothetical protein
MSRTQRLDWPAGEEFQQVVSWPYFLSFWRKEFGYISIRRPTKDICDDCYLFYNQVKFRKRAPESPFIPVDSTDEDNEDDDLSNISDRNTKEDAVVKLEWKSEATIQEADSLETMIDKASVHVKKAKDMQQMLIGKANAALEWTNSIINALQISDERWMEAVDCIVGDYCQNLALPYLGEHQPGETYYFSPLTVNCFGLANVGMEQATLNAYIYHEGEGKKGGNNVASLIYKFLDDQGWINRGRPSRKELNIVMDNCGGQNKNRFVLRLAVLFVELRYYRRVNIIFLVAGHTKNAADRLFNLLKNVYRKSQVYTMDQLEDLLNQNQYVECTKVGQNDFLNFGKLEDSIYKQSPLTGNTKKYQLFYSHDEDMGTLYGMESNSATTSFKMDLKKGREQERQNTLSEFDVALMEPLNDVEGIRQIKQVELYTKWRKHVPDEHKSPLYDHPGDDVLQSVKDDRKNKLQYIKQRRIDNQQAELTGKLVARKSPPPKKKQQAKQKANPSETAATKAQQKKKTNKDDTSNKKKGAGKTKK